MANTVDSVIVSGGGNYTSLFDAEADLDGNSYTAGETATINCSGSTADTTEVTFAGWDTDVSIRIFGDNNTGKYSTSHYRLETNSAAQTLDIDVDETYLTDIQIKNVSTGTGRVLEYITNNGKAGYIKNCIFDGSGSGGALQVISNSTGGQIVYVYNCIAFNRGTGVAVDAQELGASAVYLFNCIGVSDSGGTFTANSADVQRVNCYAYSASGTAFDATGTTTTSASDDGSDGSSTVAYSTSSGAYFTNVTASAEDFHITTLDGDLDGVGTDLSGYFTTDIDGDTRSAWDIGVDYIAAAVTEAVGHMTTNTGYWGGVSV